MTLLATRAFETTAAEVRPAWREEAPQLYATLTLAFAGDPLCRWLYPDPARYQRHFPALAEAWGGIAVARGSALAVEDVAGAALWLPPGAASDDAAIADLLVESVALGEQSDAFRLTQAMGRAHPAEPHWYLPLIGVDPAHQGRGYGSAMLRHALRLSDRSGLPAYLEATNARTIPFYQRHGFEATGRIQIGGCPPITPMLRRARNHLSRPRPIDGEG